MFSRLSPYVCWSTDTYGFQLQYTVANPWLNLQQGLVETDRDDRSASKAWLKIRFRCVVFGGGCHVRYHIADCVSFVFVGQYSDVAAQPQLGLLPEWGCWPDFNHCYCAVIDRTTLTRILHKLTRALACLLIDIKDFVQSGVWITTPLLLKTSLSINILRDNHANLCKIRVNSFLIQYI